MTAEPAWKKHAAELAAEIARHPEVAADPTLFEDDPNDPQKDWPTDMMLAFWAKEHGLDWLRALVHHAKFTVEQLEDMTAELKKRNLVDVAGVLMEFVKDAPFEVDKVIAEAEKDSAKWPNAGQYQRKRVSRWVKSRASKTGQSSKQIIEEYSLQDWFPDHYKQKSQQ